MLIIYFNYIYFNINNHLKITFLIKRNFLKEN